MGFLAPESLVLSHPLGYLAVNVLIISKVWKFWNLLWYFFLFSHIIWRKSLTNVDLTETKQGMEYNSTVSLLLLSNLYDLRANNCRFMSSRLEIWLRKKNVKSMNSNNSFAIWWDTFFLVQFTCGSNIALVNIKLLLQL